MSICHIILNSINLIISNCYLFDKDYNNSSVEEIQPILEKNNLKSFSTKNSTKVTEDLNSEENNEMVHKITSDYNLSYNASTSSDNISSSILTSPDNSEKESVEQNNSEYTSDEDCLFEF